MKNKTKVLAVDLKECLGKKYPSRKMEWDNVVYKVLNRKSKENQNLERKIQNDQKLKRQSSYYDFYCENKLKRSKRKYHKGEVTLWWRILNYVGQYPYCSISEIRNVLNMNSKSNKHNCSRFTELQISGLLLGIRDCRPMRMVLTPEGLKRLKQASKNLS